MTENVKQWLYALNAKQISARESVELVLKRVSNTDDKISALLSVRAEDALAQADEIDDKRAKDENLGALAGLPIAVKDVLCEKDYECTCASKILKGYFPPYDATVIERLKNAGVIIVGRLNMDEFAMGSSTENSAFLQTKNPWDIERIPGGSSGGSAASVAARQFPFTIGSDTGGSIRQPAALCGVTGLKPTYGRVSRYGLVAYASSLDQIGPVTLNSEDAAIVMNVIAGHDNKDSTSADIPVPDYTSNLSDKLTGLKIGVPKEYFKEGIDVEVNQSVKTALDQLQNLGAEIVVVTGPNDRFLDRFIRVGDGGDVFLRGLAGGVQV